MRRVRGRRRAVADGLAGLRGLDVLVFEEIEARLRLRGEEIETMQAERWLGDQSSRRLRDDLRDLPVARAVV